MINSQTAVYVISVAADLAGMHPQTLRQYDRLGLVIPQRTRGRGRRYSADDVAKLRLIQRLSQDEGINLAGIKRILELREEVESVKRQLEDLEGRLHAARAHVAAADRVFAAGSGGDIVSIFKGQRPRTRIAGALLPARDRQVAPVRVVPGSAS